jgi:hypothetical protein
MGRAVRFRGVKATPKTLEKDLLAKAGRLATNPSLLVPKCERGCRRCGYDKLLKKMEKVAHYKDDAEALQDLATRGDQLVRAYAATISLAASGKIPYLTSKKLPWGDVSFAVRGKVEPEYLIGVQYFDDPDLRLLAFFQDAKDSDLHIYSSPESLHCSSDGAEVPPTYSKEMLATAPYELKPDNSCGHPEAVIGLMINWRSAKIKIFVCQECADEVNLLHHLLSRIAAREPWDDFDIDVRYSPRCVADCGACRIKEKFVMSDGLKEAYEKGQLSDVMLLSRYIQEREAQLSRSGGDLYISGDECFGHNKEAFLARLKGSEAELIALSGVVRSKPMPIISVNDQAGRIIADLWPQMKEELLAQVAGPDIVKSLLASPGNLTPPQLVSEARRQQLSRSVISRLPDYALRGPIGTIADDLARTFKTEGKAAMVRHLDRNRPRETRSKAVAYGFLVAVGEADSHNWQYTKEEIDFGRYLGEFVQTLLASEGNDYDQALLNLLTACGASESLKRKT